MLKLYIMPATKHAPRRGGVYGAPDKPEATPERYTRADEDQQIRGERREIVRYNAEDYTTLNGGMLCEEALLSAPPKGQRRTWLREQLAEDRPAIPE